MPLQVSPSGAEKNENYNKIIDTVQSMLKTRPFSSITVREICKEAEVSTGTFYHYFSSKDDIMIEKLMRDNQEKAEQMREYVKGHHPFEQVLRFTQFYGDMNMDAGLEEVSSLVSPYVVWFQRRQPMVQVLEEIVANGQKQGVFVNTISTTEMAELIMDTLRGCCHCWCMQRASYNLTNRALRMVRMVMHSLVKVI